MHLKAIISDVEFILGSRTVLLLLLLLLSCFSRVRLCDILKSNKWSKGKETKTSSVLSHSYYTPEEGLSRRINIGWEKMRN